MLTFRDGTTPAEVAAVTAGLAGLPAQIPEIRGYQFGPDLGINADNADYVVIADFDSVDAYVVYRDHPAHRAVIADTIRPILASRATVQYAT
jgi:hypothetical protein